LTFKYGDIMAAKKDSMLDLDNLGKEVGKVITPERQKKPGPKISEHREGAEDKRLTIRLKDELHRTLKHASVDSGKTMSDIAIEALLEYLKKQEV